MGREQVTGQEPEGKSFLEKAAYVVTPGTVVFGLLYYFGSTYWSAYYSYFGVRVSELEFSTQDHLLGSPDALFLPLWIMLILSILGLLVFRLTERRLSRPEAETSRRLVYRVLAATGAVLLLLGFPVFLEPEWWRQAVTLRLDPGWPRDLVPPFFVALGVVMLMFALYLGRGPHRRRDRYWSSAEGLLIAVLAMVVFFDMARYAYGAGRADALGDAVHDFRNMTPVLVHSRTPISPASPDISCTDRGKAHQPFRFRCTGFRVLGKSSTRYFLVPWRRQRGGDITFVLRDDDSIHVEVLGRARGTGGGLKGLAPGR
ncbi:hypothetical protein [Streptomyces sp. NPDC051776]|uniref:hypothetical protein n=1 Tax=Streptomyces sp. NPDC051776 TaxID=3155414 RepID=UPI0034263E65